MMQPIAGILEYGTRLRFEHDRVICDAHIAHAI